MTVLQKSDKSADFRKIIASKCGLREDFRSKNHISLVPSADFKNIFGGLNGEKYLK